MTYIWDEGTNGDLTTVNTRVKEEYRSICYEEAVILYGNNPKEYFRLSLFYSQENCPEGDIEIEFEKEEDFKEFETRLERAFIIRYEDTPDELEEDGTIGRGDDIAFETSVITYADDLKTFRLTLFDLDETDRKFIVEFENKRDRTNFLNILNKTSNIRLNETG